MNTTIAILAASLILAGCKSAEITDYVVFEYDALKAEVASRSDDLAPYTVGQTIFTPFLTHRGYDAQTLRLLIWGSDVDLTVKSVTVDAVSNTTYEIEAAVQTSSLPRGSDGQRELILVESFPNTRFASPPDPIRLAIDIVVDSEAHRLTFPVKRQVRKYTAQR